MQLAALRSERVCARACGQAPGLQNLQVIPHVVRTVFADVGVPRDHGSLECVSVNVADEAHTLHVLLALVLLSAQVAESVDDDAKYHIE